MKNRTVLETTGTMEGYAEIEDFLWGDKMKKFKGKRIRLTMEEI